MPVIIALKLFDFVLQFLLCLLVFSNISDCTDPFNELSLFSKNRGNMFLPMAVGPVLPLDTVVEMTVLPGPHTPYVNLHYGPEKER